MSREVIFRDETISFEFEKLNETTALIHCDVAKFSPSTLRQWYKLFPIAKELLLRNGYNRMMTITPNPAFAKLFCGEHISTISTPEGEREIFIWELA